MLVFLWYRNFIENGNNKFQLSIVNIRYVFLKIDQGQCYAHNRKLAPAN